MAAETRKAPNDRPLTADQEETARAMLIEGATFEDIVLTLEARGQSIAQEAVESYFRSNPELHALRAARQLEIARRIRQVSGEPGSEDVQLADAVILTGLQRLNRATARLDVNDALRRHYERDNLRLKRLSHIYKTRSEEQQEKYWRARTRMLSAQWQLARQKLRQFQKELRQAKDGKTLNREIVARIQEIYGLVRAPIVPPIGAPKTEEQQAR